MSAALGELIVEGSKRGARGDLLHALANEAAYCIDAPELLPAGSHRRACKRQQEPGNG